MCLFVCDLVSFSFLLVHAFIINNTLKGIILQNGMKGSGETTMIRGRQNTDAKMLLSTFFFSILSAKPNAILR